MWTSTFLVALIVQASHGIRTFPQDQIPWKEVENEGLGHSFGKDTNKPVDDLHLEDYIKQVISTPEDTKFGPSSTTQPETTSDFFNGGSDNHFLEDLLSPLSVNEKPSQSLSTDAEPKNIIKIRRISPIYRKKLITIRIKKDPTPKNISPLPFLDAGESGGDLERIIEQAGQVMDALSSSSQTDEGQPISILRSLNQEKKTETNSNHKDIYQMLTSMMKNTATTSSNDEGPSCGSPVDENEDGSDRKTIVRIKISPMVQTFPPRNTPTPRGLMLKPLLPRDFFMIKDLLDTMKSRAMVNNNNEEDGDSFHTSPLQKPRISGRFIAFSPKIISRNISRFPPLHFPETGPQLAQSQTPEDLDLARVMKSIISTTESNDQFKDLVKRFQNRNVQTASDLHSFNNDYEDDGDSESEVDDLVKSLMPALAGRLPSELKDSFVPAFGKIMGSGRFDLTRDIPIHYRRQLMRMTLGK